MAFSLEAYKQRTGRLVVDDLDLDGFGSDPLDADVLRCLRYMHDVEYHTICYLRDLLLTPAHADPAVTSFLSLWVYEEFWHGEAIARVLDAHGEDSGNVRVARTRSALSLKDRARPMMMALGGWIGRSDFTAVHMAWGAINEWTTQAGYAQLARKAAHPLLSELLQRIMRQEGRHIDFYATQARVRLDASRRARQLARWALSNFWRPVGSGVMRAEETCFLTRYLLADEPGMAAVRRVDASIARLPGLGGLTLLGDAVTANLADDAAVAARPAAS